MLPLPAPPSEFFGRQREINKLVSFFPTQKVMIIAGLAGIGKTAIALTFANHLNQNTEYQDRVMWVTCQKGWQAMDLITQIVTQISDLAGSDEDIADSLKQGSAELVIKLLEKYGIVLFIDDFHAIENDETRQLLCLAKEYLLKGKLIVTTRRRVALSPLDRVDLFERRLDGLSLEDSCKLIGKLLRLHGFGDLEEDKFEKIYYKVKGHPFSIKLFISLLVSGGYSLDSLLDTSSEFEEEMERFLLDKVWEILEASEQEVLKALSILRIPIKAEEYPLINTPKLRKSLRQMLDMYLVEYNKEGRIFLHDLLRDYTKNKLDEKLQKKLQLSVAEFLSSKKNPEINELQEAYFHFHEAGKAREAIDAIFRISEQFYMLGEESESLYHLVNDALSTGNNYRYDELILIKVRLLVYMKKFAEAEELLSEVKDKSHRIFIKGRINWEKGQFSEAVKCFSDCMTARISENLKLEIYNGTAICYFYLGEWKKSEENYRKALKQAEYLDIPIMRGRILSNLAVLINRMGQPYQAIENYDEAEVILRQNNSLTLLSRVLFNKANLYSNALMDLEKAKASLAEATEVMESIRDNEGLVYNYGLYGDISFFEGDYELAREHYSKALKIAEKYADIKMLVEINFNLGKILGRIGNLEEAESYFNTAFKLNAKVDSPLGEALLNQEYAQFMLTRGENDKAYEMLEDVRAFCTSTQHQELLVRALYFLAKTAELLSRNDEKEEFYQEYLKMVADLPNPVKERLKKEFNWFEEFVFTKESKAYMLISSKDGKKAIESRELNQIRASKDKYEIFIDYIEHELLIKGEKIKFFKKRTLVPLLAELIVDPGKILDFASLFEQVWGREYDPETDGVTLRVNISRLRSLLGDRKGNEYFIRSSSDVGGYYFNDQTDYCIVMPND